MFKMILKKEKAFQIINTVLVVMILGFYFGRMFYYKNKLKVVYSNSSYDALSTVMVERNDLVATDRLYENEDGSYYFYGDVKNNYVSFGGLLYRVISIDADGNFKIIADESVTGFLVTEEQSFEYTDLNCWLNLSGKEHSGIFETSIANYSAYISKGTYNYSMVADINNISTDHIVNSTIGVLTIDEYIKAGGAKSYLNQGESFWLGNQDASGNYYYVDGTGAVGASYNDVLFLGVRPVLTISYTVKALGGTGTESDPYLINEVKANLSKDLFVGAYVQFSGYLWRVQEVNDVVILMLVSEIETKSYYGKSQLVDLNRGAAYALNHDFLDTLNTAYLEEYQWNYGILDSSYSYLCNYQNEYTAFVGLPTTADLFLLEGNNYHLSTAANQSSDLIYMVKDNYLYADMITEEASLKGKIALKLDIKINEGNGTKEQPYSFEVISYE